MAKKTSPKTLEIHYVKTSSYRTFHADGFYGGVTPMGKMYLEVFLDRHATPQIVKHNMEEPGKLGAEIERTGKKGTIRQIEAGIIFDVNIAESLIVWLQQKVQEYNNLFPDEDK